ncbi:hypothetical protein EDD15DRAFT_2197815 [Pisolithus albus]|nr:hypothetical protein EDD15DRAFT_2197815 [Pisolithus albus]
MAAPQRHPKYWFLDGNIVFQADSTLFRLHKGVLFVHSPTLENIFALPSGVENDGEDEDHPIFLPGISGEEFDHFMSWLYHVSGALPHDQNLSSLVAILKVSHLWQIENSIAWAIAHLNQLELSAVHKLELECKYTIHNGLPLLVYSIIARAREVMEMEWRTIAAVPPGLSLPPSPACNNSHHVHCKDVWTRFWWQKVARQLLHPYNPLAISALVEYVSQQTNPDGLNLECKARFIGQVVESGGLEVEENIIYGAITAVQAYFETL